MQHRFGGGSALVLPMPLLMTPASRLASSRSVSSPVIGSTRANSSQRGGHLTCLPLALPHNQRYIHTGLPGAQPTTAPRNAAI